MAKSPSKAADPVEVIEDSEEERPKSSKKKDDAASEDPDEEEGDEEEYEIEAILDARIGAVQKGIMGYLVKWKGYGEEHNSWVNDDDAQGAAQMIEEYWAKNRKNNKSKHKQAKARKSDAKVSSPDADADADADTPSSSNKRKKAASAASRKSKSIQPEADEPMEEDEDKPKPKKTKTIARAEEEMDVDPIPTDADEPDTEYLPMNITKYKDKSWEKLVDRVDTIEKIDGILKVFFTLNNGEKVVETSRTCAKHFPQKLIQFYESNLRWRESEVSEEL